MATETFQYKADNKALMDLIVNAFYSQKEIFLRELVSNASDALDKIRHRSLTDKELLAVEPELYVRVAADKDAKTVTITDTGVGMTREELIENLGTVAKSGTKAFMEQLQDSKNSGLIGQFGVGFYSSFLVADNVEVTSRAAGSEEAFRWVSTSSDGTFAVDAVDDFELGRGTRLVLHLKDDAEEYLDESRLKDVLKKHSYYISYPIELYETVTEEVPVDSNEQDAVGTLSEKEFNEKINADSADVPQVEEVNEEVPQVEEVNEEVPQVEEVNEEVPQVEEVNASTTDVPQVEEVTAKSNDKITVEDVEEDDEDDEDNKEHENQPNKKTKAVEKKKFIVINNHKPLWTKDKDSITEEEYQQFYQSLAQSDDKYITVKHFKVEGQLEFTGLLYIPRKAPHDMFQSKQKESHVKLHVKKVFITDKCTDLVPDYLSFLRGIVDSNDLPLNVSREMLQESAAIKIMCKKVTSKALEMLADLADNEKEYLGFYKEFSRNIKLGVHEDTKNKDKLTKLLRFYTKNHKDEPISLDKYVEEMKENQKEIYYVSGESMESLENTPFLESLKKKGYDALLLVDPIDEYAIQKLDKYDDKSLKCVTKEGFKLDEDSKVEDTDETKKLTEYFSQVLGNKVEKVVLSNSLVSSPCVLTTNSYGWSANMQRIMKSQTLKNDDPMTQFMMGRKVMELNPSHRLVKLVNKHVKEGTTSETTEETVHLLYDTSVSPSGFTLEDPQDYAQRVYKMMADRFGLEEDQEDQEDQEENVADDASTTAPMPSLDTVVEETDVDLESDKNEDQRNSVLIDEDSENEEVEENNENTTNAENNNENTTTVEETNGEQTATV